MIVTQVSRRTTQSNIIQAVAGNLNHPSLNLLRGDAEDCTATSSYFARTTAGKFSAGTLGPQELTGQFSQLLVLYSARFLFSSIPTCLGPWRQEGVSWASSLPRKVRTDDIGLITVTCASGNAWYTKLCSIWIVALTPEFLDRLQFFCLFSFNHCSNFNSSYLALPERKGRGSVLVHY